MTLRSYRGKAPTVADGAYVDRDCIAIGEVSIGQDATIWPGAILRADDDRIEIGQGTAVMDMAFIEAPKGEPVTIGCGCIVSHGAMLHGCTIADGVMIGIGAIVLDRASLEKGAILAAGSVVPPGQRVPPASLAMGAPAKVVREVTEEEQRRLSEYLETVRAKAAGHALEG